MSAPPYLALSVTYWLHMLATVTWIGSLACLSLLVLPAARRTFTSELYARFLESLQRKLDPLGWISLLVLTGTGMFQMSSSPNYSGFLAIDNRWAAAILVKHIVFLGMTGISAYITWGLLPALRRAALRMAHGQESPESERLQQREALLIRINLILGMLVLALTALARAS